MHLHSGPLTMLKYMLKEVDLREVRVLMEQRSLRLVLVTKTTPLNGLPITGPTGWRRRLSKSKKWPGIVKYDLLLVLSKSV